MCLSVCLSLRMAMPVLLCLCALIHPGFRKLVCIARYAVEYDPMCHMMCALQGVRRSFLDRVFEGGLKDSWCAKLAAEDAAAASKLEPRGLRGGPGLPR